MFAIVFWETLKINASINSLKVDLIRTEYNNRMTNVLIEKILSGEEIEFIPKAIELSVASQADLIKPPKEVPFEK